MKKSNSKRGLEAASEDQMKKTQTSVVDQSPLAKMLALFGSARRTSAPIVVVRSADQFAAVDVLSKHEDAKDLPLFRWDAVRGLNGLREDDAKHLKGPNFEITPDDTVGFVEALLAAQMLKQGSVVFALNAHRQLASTEPSATAQAIQAIANIRETFKKNFRTLVLLGPYFVVPPELEHDVVVLDHPLPNEDEIAVILRELFEAAKQHNSNIKTPSQDVVSKAVAATTGISSFGVEQIFSMSMSDEGLDVEGCWERKRTTIELTRGLSVYRGKETLDDLRGLESIKKRLRMHAKAKHEIGLVVWIDEGADVFTNVEHDTSGVKTDQQRALLIEMEQNAWPGIISIGVPGTGKSAVAKAFGNELGVPTVSLDFGDMEGPHVGESEAMLRHAIAVMKAIAGNRKIFFFLTANSLRGIRPQFQARFRRGTFFHDLPTADEKEAIWSLYESKLGLKKQQRPNDDGWCPREIRECCESAYDLNTTLVDAAEFIVPVARARANEIEEMRKEAHGRFLDASRPGSYRYDAKPMVEHVRAIAFSSVPKDQMN